MTRDTFFILLFYIRNIGNEPFPRIPHLDVGNDFYKNNAINGFYI